MGDRVCGVAVQSDVLGEIHPVDVDQGGADCKLERSLLILLVPSYFDEGQGQGNPRIYATGGGCFTSILASITELHLTL